MVVDTSASASLPVGLTAVMGFTRLDIEAGAQAVRRDLDLALVLDASTSLAPAAQQVRDAALQFLERFDPDTDRVALLHFAYGAVVDAPIRTEARGFDRPALRAQLQALRFNGYTNSAEGVWQGQRAAEWHCAGAAFDLAGHGVLFRWRADRALRRASGWRRRRAATASAC